MGMNSTLVNSIGFLKRSCPNCRRAASSNEINSTPKAENSSWTDLGQSWAGFFKSKLFFTYNRCVHCGLLYCPSYFTEEQLDALYASMADNTAGLGADKMVRTQAGYVSMIDGRDFNGDFLELGPDIGLFTLPYAQEFDKKKKRKYWLFEPNVLVHDALKNRMEGYDIAIRTTLTNMSEIPDGSLGSAVLVHVLDHLLDPLSVLRDLRKKMRPKAWIHIVTHNEKSLLARCLGVRWPAYCLQHPQLYNPATITALLSEAGYTVDIVQRTINYFPSGYLVRHGLFALGLNFPLLNRFLGFQIGLRLGNIMTSAQVAAVRNQST